MSPISLAQQWSRNAQQQARRNAMVALTQCTRRRAEREEVEHFLAARADAARAETLDTSVSLHA
jgi:hypothetical protein